MIVYEVTLRVEAGSAEAFRAWLGTHVGEMLDLPGFVGADIFRIEPASASDAEHGWTVHYRLRDRAALDVYLAEHAPRMRADGLARFAGRFSAERRILHAEPPAQAAD